jgi:hypothetical protein
MWKNHEQPPLFLPKTIGEVEYCPPLKSPRGEFGATGLGLEKYFLEGKCA